MKALSGTLNCVTFILVNLNNGDLHCSRKTDLFDKFEMLLFKSQILKSKTITFVENGEKEDPDLLLRFLRLIPWQKCGIHAFTDNDNSNKKDNYGSLAMSNHVPDKSNADIDAGDINVEGDDDDTNTNRTKVVEQEQEENDNLL